MTAKLRMDKVTKTFPGVRALDSVSIEVDGGEVLGLVGVNGAGKSTLMNVLGGILTPDTGQISIDGSPVELLRPIDADHAGIAFIHQELLNFPSMTVAENMFMSHLPAGVLPFTVDKRTAGARAGEALAQLGSNIRPTDRMEELSVGERQIVEIARAIAMGSKIVIFDEPSSSLSIREKEALYSVVRRLRSEGKAIIYISHFLDEIQELCDSYAVLRNGRMVGSGRVAQVSRSRIVELIVGEALEGQVRRERRLGDTPVLTVKGLRRGEVLRGVDLQMRQGEVLGLWGLMGSGRTELIRSVLGLDPCEACQVFLHDGESAREISKRELLSRSAYVTESRRTDGLFLGESIWKNISATTLREFARGRMKFLDTGAEMKSAQTICSRLRVRSPGHRTKVEILSGGNQQKVVFAKWLNHRLETLFLDEPTRGVDVGSKQEIAALIESLADQGTAVLLVTSEVEEMVALADRVLVLRNGTIAAELTSNRITETALIAASMGTGIGDA